MVDPLVAQLALRHPPQLFVHERKQSIQRRTVSVRQRDQGLSNVRRSGHSGRSVIIQYPFVMFGIAWKMPDSGASRYPPGPKSLTRLTIREASVSQVEGAPRLNWEKA